MTKIWPSTFQCKIKFWHLWVNVCRLWVQNKQSVSCQRSQRWPNYLPTIFFRTKKKIESESIESESKRSIGSKSEEMFGENKQSVGRQWGRQRRCADDSCGRLLANSPLTSQHFTPRAAHPSCPPPPTTGHPSIYYWQYILLTKHTIDKVFFCS